MRDGRRYGIARVLLQLYHGIRIPNVCAVTGYARDRCCTRVALGLVVLCRFVAPLL